MTRQIFLLLLVVIATCITLRSEKSLQVIPGRVNVLQLVSGGIDKTGNLILSNPQPKNTFVSFPSWLNLNGTTLSGLPPTDFNSGLVSIQYFGTNGQNGIYTF